MAFNAEITKLQIEELKTVQFAIIKRIEELKEAAGITSDDFEEEFEWVKDTLEAIIKNRSEHDDAHSLWRILRLLQDFNTNIIAFLHGLTE